jgi:pyruvate,water dikinase
VALQQPQQLPVPDNFRFEWDTPEEATRFWAADLMHWPNGISTLSATMDMPAFVRGLLKAAETLRMPFDTERSAFKVINGYVYNSFTPYSTDPAQMNARMVQMQAQMGKHIPGLLDRWRSEYEPEVRSINDETLNMDYSKLGDRDLGGLLQTLLDKREREGELHFLAVFPAGGAVMFFEQVYSNLFGEPDANEHLQLLQGFPNKSVEAGVGLWNLALEARRRAPVMALLQRVDPSAMHEALLATPEGRAFRGAVEEFLRKYGWRGNELDVAAPTWAEDPTVAYKMIREYASRDDYDPEEELRSLVAARVAREELLLGQLSGSGQVEMFQQALAGAQQYLPVQEDHNFWIDQQGVAVQRVPVLEAAKRLTETTRLVSADDVFFLTYDELQDALRGGKGDLMELVRRRRREQEENRKLTPPAVLGTPPPPEAEDNPMQAKFFGAPPPESPDPRIINGNAASSGKVTGTARVIMSLDGQERLRPGEILVCPATMPPWTPLFGIAAGVVTDHGGVLSHTAIVAREYRIPAVVGTKMGTALIRDGQTITVDGGAGTVRLEG